MAALQAALSGLNWEMGLIGLGFMIAILSAAAGVRAMTTPVQNEIVDRIDRVVGRADSTPRGAGATGSLLARLARPFVTLLRPTRADEQSRLRTRLVQAGLRSVHAMELFLASKLLLATAATITFLQVNSQLVKRLESPLDIGVTVWLCGAGFMLPSLWLSSRIRTRQQTLERSLPDAMDLIVTCVEAGLGLDAAVARVSDELKLASPLLGFELNQTFLEIQTGIPRRDAFRRLAERTGLDELRQLSAVLTQTEMFGTSIAKALRVQAEGMRIRRMQRAEEKANTVGVKMTLPLILCILPALVAVVLGPAVVSILEHIIKGGGSGQ
jgi:tight adherence protein C